MSASIAGEKRNVWTKTAFAFPSRGATLTSPSFAESPKSIVAT